MISKTLLHYLSKQELQSLLNPLLYCQSSVPPHNPQIRGSDNMANLWSARSIELWWPEGGDGDESEPALQLLLAHGGLEIARLYRATF